MLVHKEAGAVMVEFALIIPFLLFSTFMGYEYTKIADLRLAKNDLVRALALTYPCANKQESPIAGVNPAANCFEEKIETLKVIADSVFPGVELAVQAFHLGDDSQSIRESGCSAYNSISSKSITRTSAFIPEGFELKYGSTSNPSVVSDVFSLNDTAEMRQLCLNNQILVVELRLLRKPMFKFTTNIVTSTITEVEHNEYAFI